MADEKPDYKVYRSRPRLLRRRDEGGAAAQGLQELRAPDQPPRDYEVQRGGRRLPRLPAFPGRGPRAPRGPRRITVGRVVKWLVLALLAWVALSAVLFMVSAQM